MIFNYKVTKYLAILQFFRTLFSIISYPELALISIGKAAFAGCGGLTSLTIPNSVVSIGENAFVNCHAIELLNYNAVCADFMGGGTKSPFYGLNVSNINIGNSVQKIPDSFAYGLTKLTSMIIPNSVSTIGGGAFYGCSRLMNVTIPNSVTFIGRNAFYDCEGLTSVRITDLAAWCKISFEHIYANPNSYANPLYYAHHLYLNGSEVTELIIPDSITSINDFAFHGCSGLTSVIIPNSVISIGRYAFYGCSGLTSVSISNSVNSFGNSVFFGCPNISRVISMKTNPPICWDLTTFNNNVYNHAQLHVPEGSERVYATDQYWGQFVNIIGDVNDNNPSDDSDYLKCDVNGDSEVNIADVNRVIDAILNH